MRCLRTERNVDKGENIYGLTNNTLELNLINRNKDAIYILKLIGYQLMKEWNYLMEAKKKG